MSESIDDQRGEGLDSEKVYRISVNFSEEAYRTLRDLASLKGKSVADVLRDALALEKWYTEARQSGARVLVEHRGGRVEEVTLG